MIKTKEKMEKGKASMQIDIQTRRNLRRYCDVFIMAYDIVDENCPGLRDDQIEARAARLFDRFFDDQASAMQCEATDGLQKSVVQRRGLV